MIENVNSKLTAINDTLRDISGGTDKMGLDDMSANLGTLNSEIEDQIELIEQIGLALRNKSSTESYDAGYEAGTRDENERFWKTIQTKLAWYSGTGWVEVPRTSYIYAFRQWYTAKEINPLYPIEADGVTQMFESCQCITKHPPITFLQPLSTYAMFNGCRELKEAIGEFRLTGNCSAMFNGCYALTKVNKLIIEGTVTWGTNAFALCSKLVELNIEGTIDTAFNASACVALNKASLTNVMNILSTTTSGLTCTFSKVAVDKAFETSEGANDGSISTEWTTLVNSRSNWTISLV